MNTIARYRRMAQDTPEESVSPPAFPETRTPYQFGRSCAMTGYTFEQSMAIYQRSYVAQDVPAFTEGYNSAQ
jgi:hypothetical protein